MRLSVAALALALSVAAHADNSTPAPNRGDTPRPEDAAAAREHYKRGIDLYDVGKFLEAAAEFQAAFDLKPIPKVLYNIAQSYRLGKRPTQALRAYRRYLRLAPDTRDRDVVERQIAELEKLPQ